MLDEAIFTALGHRLWSGSGLIGVDGKLRSLLVQQLTGEGTPQDLNMVVPINLLPPVLDDLLWSDQQAGEALARLVFV
jgi:S1-C subfamily serine protease